MERCWFMGKIFNFPIKNNSKKLVQVNSKNNLIKTDKRLIATIGVNDLIIVDSNDSTLIAKKGLEENMKDLISYMSNKNIQKLKKIYLKMTMG